MLLLHTTVSSVGARLGRLRARQDGVTAVESTTFDDTAGCIAGPGGSTDCPTPSSRP
jgi:hypothetical protein